MNSNALINHLVKEDPGEKEKETTPKTEIKEKNQIQFLDETEKDLIDKIKDKIKSKVLETNLFSSTPADKISLISDYELNDDLEKILDIQVKNIVQNTDEFDLSENEEEKDKEEEVLENEEKINKEGNLKNKKR
jgi:hypothetical protein